MTIYGDARIPSDPRLDRVLQTFNKQTMQNYWPGSRNLVNEMYSGIAFPFSVLPAPELKLNKLWTLRQLAGYIRSWSATVRYIEQNGHDPVVALESEMQALWRDGKEAREISWPFRIFAGRFEEQS